MTTQKVTLEIASKAALKQVYLPFVKEGGLIITLSENLSLYSEVMVQLKLFEEDPLTFVGRVVWINPQKIQQNTSVGVQLQGENAKLIKERIETHLAGML